jgi:hypothetical protein
MYLATTGTHSVIGCTYLTIGCGFIVGIHMSLNILYIKSTVSVCDGRFGGWGKGEPGETAGDRALLLHTFWGKKD